MSLYCKPRNRELDKGGTPRTLNPIVYMEISIGGVKAGKLTMELRQDIVPTAVENFRALCTGECGTVNGVKMHYKGTRFHRIVRDRYMQGGDIREGDGSWNQSIFGNLFEDENFMLRHVGPGIISMVNEGPDTNGCQFYITTVKTAWMDERHVAIGYCIDEESLRLVERIDHIGTEHGRPMRPVVISDCGQLYP
mmetsp:Transcript_9749/g.28635  ORF Transcript_9749/g.28635 Transcript_9749/m.28635 type:complete len:194 (-) Transcript_9749:289-870(-)